MVLCDLIKIMLRFIIVFFKLLLGTSKNPSRHAELVSASPRYQEIADQVRNDDCANSVVFRSPLLLID